MQTWRREPTLDWQDLEGWPNSKAPVLKDGPACAGPLFCEGMLSVLARYNPMFANCPANKRQTKTRRSAS